MPLMDPQYVSNFLNAEQVLPQVLKALTQAQIDGEHSRASFPFTVPVGIDLEPYKVCGHYFILFVSQSESMSRFGQSPQAHHDENFEAVFGPRAHSRVFSSFTLPPEGDLTQFKSFSKLEQVETMLGWWLSKRGGFWASSTDQALQYGVLKTEYESPAVGESLLDGEPLREDEPMTEDERLKKIDPYTWLMDSTKLVWKTIEALNDSLCAGILSSSSSTPHHHAETHSLPATPKRPRKSDENQRPSPSCSPSSSKKPRQPRSSGVLTPKAQNSSTKTPQSLAQFEDEYVPEEPDLDSDSDNPEDWDDVMTTIPFGMLSKSSSEPDTTTSVFNMEGSGSGNIFPTEACASEEQVGDTKSDESAEDEDEGNVVSTSRDESAQGGPKSGEALDDDTDECDPELENMLLQGYADEMDDDNSHSPGSDDMSSQAADVKDASKVDDASHSDTALSFQSPTPKDRYVKVDDKRIAVAVTTEGSQVEENEKATGKHTLTAVQTSSLTKNVVAKGYSETKKIDAAAFTSSTTDDAEDGLYNNLCSSHDGSDDDLFSEPEE